MELTMGHHCLYPISIDKGNACDEAALLEALNSAFTFDCQRHLAVSHVFHCRNRGASIFIHVKERIFVRIGQFR